MLDFEPRGSFELRDDLSQDHRLSEGFRSDAQGCCTRVCPADVQQREDECEGRYPVLAPRRLHDAGSPSKRRWARTNRVTNGSAGCVMKSRSEPRCTTRPACSSTSTCPRNAASPKSCVTSTTVLPKRSKMRARSACKSARTM